MRLYQINIVIVQLTKRKPVMLIICQPGVAFGEKNQITAFIWKNLTIIPLLKATKDPLLTTALAWFLAFILTFNIHYQGEGNGAIGHKAPEVFT